jgi:hypothetical protein
MPLYWIAYRFAGEGADDRRDEVIETIGAMFPPSQQQWWREIPGLILIDADKTIDGVAHAVSAHVNLKTDLIVVIQPDLSDAVIVGDHLDADLTRLIPNSRKREK